MPRGVAVTMQSIHPESLRQGPDTWAADKESSLCTDFHCYAVLAP